MKRNVHFDLLRILAAFLIVILHSSARLWYTDNVYSADWVILQCFNTPVRVAVPLFVMISGAFTLGRQDLTVKKIFSKNILRMAIIFTVWALVYDIGFVVKKLDVIKAGEYGASELFESASSTHYHLWFIPMIIGLYILSPVINEWFKNAKKSNVEYVLAVFIVFQIARVSIFGIVNNSITEGFADYFDIPAICGYIGYYILGAYLYKFGLSEKVSRLVKIFGFISIPCSIILAIAVAHHNERVSSIPGDTFNIFIFIMCVALFDWAVKKTEEGVNYSEKKATFIANLSKDTLGVYVMHLGLMTVLDELKLTEILKVPVVGVLVHSIVCFIVCAVIGAVIRRIPKIGKYLA